jgi:regulation of enolase protein 1 (concanavalin A-like superfamily)
MSSSADFCGGAEIALVKGVAMTIGMQWYNPPDVWSEADSVTSVTTNAGTDFWRHTHYGFVRDTGHFRYREVKGDFSAQVSVKGKYTTLYDQAGLMLRRDASHWIKAGIEFTDNLPHFCVVVTNQWSDWSLIPLPEASPDVDLDVHMVRIGQTISVRYRLNQGIERVARIAAFPYQDITQIGMMCCSPERAGFEAEFSCFQVAAADGPPLHT